MLRVFKETHLAFRILSLFKINNQTTDFKSFSSIGRNIVRQFSCITKSQPSISRIFQKVCSTNKFLQLEPCQVERCFVKRCFVKRCFVTVSDQSLAFESDLIQRYLKHLLTRYNSKLVESEDAPAHHEQFSECEAIASRFLAHEQKKDDISQLKKIISESKQDLEVIKMAGDEISKLELDLEKLENEIFSFLLPREFCDQNDAILEVSAGVGGQEAMLFTKEIFDMYVNYASYKGWDLELINYDSSELGGLRHATASITGKDVFLHMKFEGGVHRVQRNPKTEKSGRLHTSTMTVAILPQPTEIDIVINPKDLLIETCRASGKGGQHVNTTDSAVRIVHLPTGMAAECQKERSQLANKESALKLLRTRLYEKEQEKAKNVLVTTRKLQVGSANRNEKIRTYNFKDDRVTDHRIGKNIFGIESVFSGEKLEELISLLKLESQQELLLEKLKQFSD